MNAVVCEHLVLLSECANAYQHLCSTRLVIGCRKLYTKLDDHTWLPERSQRLLRLLSSRIAAITGIPANQGQQYWELNLTPGRQDAPPGNVESLDAAVWFASEFGLHVDVNNGMPQRCCTALIYLTTIAGRGGCTVFPAASAQQDHPLYKAADLLLKNEVLR